MNVYICINKKRKAFLYWTSTTDVKPAHLRAKSFARIKKAVARPSGTRHITQVSKRAYDIVCERKIPPYVKHFDWEKEWDFSLLFADENYVDKIMVDLSTRATDGWACLTRQLKSHDLFSFLPPEEPLV